MLTKIVAHKGASSYAPGNTIAAYEMAISQGADCIELDVQCTRDEHLVVFHDAMLNVNGRKITPAMANASEIFEYGRASSTSSIPYIEMSKILSLDEALE